MARQECPGLHGMVFLTRLLRGQGRSAQGPPAVSQETKPLFGSKSCKQGEEMPAMTGSRKTQFTAQNFLLLGQKRQGKAHRVLPLHVHG